MAKRSSMVLVCLVAGLGMSGCSGRTSPPPSSDSIPPSAPTDLSATLISTFRIDLSWSASTDNVGVTGYRVIRNGTQVGTTTATTYNDTGLTASTEYTYVVIAFDAAGNASHSSNPLNARTAIAPTPPAYPLKLSSDGRYLVDQNDVPFFAVGEDGFLASLQLSNSDLDTYLRDRSSRGFNSIWIGLTDRIDQKNAPRDFSGNVPFGGAWFSATEVLPYWAHQDYVIQRAATYGITVFAQPSFVGNAYSQTIYDTQAMLAASDAMMTAYGTFIGNRYKNFSNIVWVLGGDYDPSQTAIKTKLADLVNGLSAADPHHLITIEACRFCSPPNQSTLDSYGVSPSSFLGLNWLYAQQPNIVSVAQANFSRSPFLPPLMGEDFYELGRSMTEFQVRQEGYWAILGGAYVGRLFGNDSIWSFNSPNDGSSTPSWQSQMTSPGSLAQQYLGELMLSREHWLMVPDAANSVLTGGFESGATLSVAARTSDGQTIIAYFSDGNSTTKTIDMTKIISSISTVKEWWYNPRNGVATLIGTHPNSGSQNFGAPDGSDWVLVLDDASANLPSPGSTVESSSVLHNRPKMARSKSRRQTKRPAATESKPNT